MRHMSQFLSTVVLGTVAAVLLSVGCQQETANGVAASTQKVSPEESFQEIATLFAQSVQTGAGGMPGGFIAREEDGHSRLVIKNNVTNELIKPTKTGEPYRGVITVSSQYDYSLQRIAGSELEDERGDDRDDADRDSERRGWDDGGARILDDDLIKRPSTNRKPESQPSEDIIARRSDEVVSKYELEYVDGRWELKTPLNPDTEQAIANAFNHILSLQP